MLRLLSLFIIVFQLSSCAQLQQVVENLPQVQQAPTIDIAAGLTLGIDKQVSKLTQKDGFFKNERVKIVLPEALTKVDKALRTIGLSNLADEGLKVLNRAAEDAVKEATPIFISAVKDIKFEDAKTILLGNHTAATEYLTTKTEKVLYQKFNPVIQHSFTSVGADKIWNTLIQKYNKIPFTESVNTDLTDYVTKEALKGVYKMIAIEEAQIRTQLSSRTTTLLQQVFKLQD
jgi:methylthioribose-1-phosphate isomerase